MKRVKQKKKDKIKFKSYRNSTSVHCLVPTMQLKSNFGIYGELIKVIKNEKKIVGRFSTCSNDCPSLFQAEIDGVFECHHFE